MSFLVDTNVLSDPSRLQPSPKVDAWLAAHQSQIYTSAISIGEIKRGIERLPTGAKRNGLEKWLEAGVQWKSGLDSSAICLVVPVTNPVTCYEPARL